MAALVFILPLKQQQQHSIIQQQYQHVHSKSLFHKYGFNKLYNPKPAPKASLIYRITAVNWNEKNVAKKHSLTYRLTKQITGQRTFAFN